MLVDEARQAGVPDLTVELLDDEEQMNLTRLWVFAHLNRNTGYPHILAVKLRAATGGKTQGVTICVPTELTVGDGEVELACATTNKHDYRFSIKNPAIAAGMSLADLARLPLGVCVLAAAKGDSPARELSAATVAGEELLTPGYLLDHASRLFNGTKRVLGKRGCIVPHESEYTPDFPYYEVGEENGKMHTRLSYIPAELDPKHLPTGEELSNAITDAVDKLPALGLDEQDVLTFITDTWLRSKKDSFGRVSIKAKDYYRLRGIKEHKGGSGTTGGFGKYFDKRFETALYNLASIWVEVPSGEVVYKDGKPVYTKHRRSPIIKVTGEGGDMDKNFVLSTNLISIVFGDLFAEVLKYNSSYLYTPAAVLALDPDRQRIEKSIGYRLCYLWRVRAARGELGQAYTVKSLLEYGNLEVDSVRPARSRDRLETALGTLEDKGIIAGWQYRADDFATQLPRKDWLPTWQKWRVEIEPPARIFELYKTIQPPNHKPVVLPEGKPKSQLLADRLKLAAKAKGMTQLMLAEDIGMSQGKLSQILSGKRLPGRQTYAKIEKWLAANK